MGGETDSYTLNAQQNDKWYFRIQRTSGSFRPYIGLLDSAANRICYNYTSGAYVEATCSITTTGTYRLFVRDSVDATVYTGNYLIYGQRMNSPAASTAVDFGTQTIGQIQYGIESDVYRFEATINDKLDIRVHRDSGALDPSMYVYDADGTQLCGSYTSGDYVGLNCTVTKTSTYFIFIEDSNSTNVGSYTLHLQRRNNPSNATSITFGTPVSSNIGVTAEIDTYTFNASANDKAFLRIYKSSGSLRPSLYVYNQAGDSICGSYTSGAFVGFDCPINTSGKYTVYVEDTNATETGNYTIYLQRSNNPGNATALSLGQTVNGEIAAIGAFSTYTFIPKQDDKIDIDLARTAGSMGFYALVYNAAGDVVCSNYTNAAALSIKNCAIKTNGQHTLLIFDLNDDAVGTYRLSLGCATGTCGPPPPTPTLRPVLYLPMLQ